MKHLSSLLLCLLLFRSYSTEAQLVSRNYRDCPMTQVLSDLSKAAQPRLHIAFIYNDLEDYTVTQQFDSLTIPEAVRKCIGFYPISVTQRGDSLLLIECTQKKTYKLIGRLIDEHNMPVSYANITLTSTTDTTHILNKGVSNQNGRLVIPCDSPVVMVRISHVGYQPISRRIKATDIGDIKMSAATEQLNSINVKASLDKRAEKEYLRLQHKVEEAIWDMPLPQFSLDTVPHQFRDAAAVVLAEYDSIAYVMAEKKYSQLFGSKTKSRWLRTHHLHRIRYIINREEAISKLSTLTFSKRTDITNYMMYKTTVVGIHIVKSDGSMRTVDTFNNFKPQAHKRLSSPDETDSISIGPLETGDILDIFFYHNFNEPITPYRLTIPSTFPVVNYKARVVADDDVQMQYSEHGIPPAARHQDATTPTIALAYDLSHYTANHPSYTDIEARIDAGHQKNKTNHTISK